MLQNLSKGDIKQKLSPDLKGNMMKWFLVVFMFAGSAQAEQIAKVKAKGLIFKDTITVEAFDDPDIQGVTCYTTVYSRALTFSDSSSSSLSCRQTGLIKGKLTAKSSVFSRSKNPFFKETVVDRFYDKNRSVLVYLSYTKATDGDNASNSISVVVVQ